MNRIAVLVLAALGVLLSVFSFGTAADASPPNLISLNGEDY